MYWQGSTYGCRHQRRSDRGVRSSSPDRCPNVKLFGFARLRRLLTRLYTFRSPELWYRRVNTARDNSQPWIRPQISWLFR